MYFNNSDHLKFLIEKLVRINRGGPESKTGRLMAIKDDHLVLWTEEADYLYYQRHQVKSVTFNSMDATDPIGSPDKHNPPYVDVNNFQDILRNMLYRMVQINQGGHESVRGVLIQLLEDHIDLVHDHEIIKIPTYHIKNISYALEKQATDSKNVEAQTVEVQSGSETLVEQPTLSPEVSVAQSSVSNLTSKGKPLRRKRKIRRIAKIKKRLRNKNRATGKAEKTIDKRLYKENRGSMALGKPGFVWLAHFVRVNIPA
jgi:spore coat protein B